MNFTRDGCALMFNSHLQMLCKLRKSFLGDGQFRICFILCDDCLVDVQSAYDNAPELG